MAIVSSLKNLRSFRGSQAVGLPNLYGTSRYGWSQYGVYMPFAGVYRVRRFGKNLIQERMDFFEGKNIHSTGQNTLQTKFGNAVAGWQALSNVQKAVYNKRAIGRRYFGYHLFIREFMKL